MRVVAAVFAFLFCAQARAADVFPAEHEGLRIEVDARFEDFQTWGWREVKGKEEWRWEGGYVIVEVAVRNVSQQVLRIPTTPYLPRNRRSVAQWANKELIVFHFEPPKFRNSVTQFSEARFDPVEFGPGEAVLIGRIIEFTSDAKLAKMLQRVTVRFHVSSLFPERLRWWRGTIGVEQPVSRKWTDVPPDKPDEVKDAAAK